MDLTIFDTLNKIYYIEPIMKRMLYPSGIILHKHNTDNQAVTYNFNLTFKGDQYSRGCCPLYYDTFFYEKHYKDMAEVIKMPKMSDTMQEGTIVSWLIKVGDNVKSGDILAEIETDKATMELESYDDGVLLYLGAKEKEKVAVGSILAIIGEQGEDYSSFIKNDIKESNSEIRQQSAEYQNEVSKEPTADINQQTSEQQSKEPSRSQVVDENNIQNKYIPKDKSIEVDNRIKISPLAKKVAQEMGYNINELKGSGDAGRIILRDLQENDNKKVSNGETFFKKINTNSWKEEYVDTEVTSMRSAISTRLKQSLANAPHFYLTTDVNMDKVIEMKEALNKEVQISFNDIILKAVSMAIQRSPNINTSWIEKGGNIPKIRLNKHIHLGIAVALEDGIVVPVIKFVNNKSILQISAESREIVGKAKNKKLSVTEIQGATFCISNLGMFDIDNFTSIINPPSSCILAVGAIKKTVVVKNNNISIGHVMKLTLSCDHRTIDGVVGAKFMSTLKAVLEEPLSMIFAKDM